MVKLYRRGGQAVEYWEAWDEANGFVTVHWGKLGQTGQSKSMRVPPGEPAEAFIAALAQPRRGEGYAEIDLEDHAQLVVQYRTEGWGSTDDLDRRHKVEGVLNECLGWTGNGHCDGGDIGSGSINVFSFVVDPHLARDAIVAALRDPRLLDGAVIAVARADNFEVLWPPDHPGDFSTL
jgi:hypothetical protein